MIYLAQPYTHKDSAIRDARYRAALRIVADYTKMEFLIYSPIVHYHNVALAYDLPVEFDFWRTLNFEALKRCNEIWILPLTGWETSAGLRAEIKEAQRLYKRDTYLWEDAKRLGV